MDIDCQTCRWFPGLDEHCGHGDVPMSGDYVTAGSCPEYEWSPAKSDALDQAKPQPQNAKAYSHYFKPCPYDHVDPYRVTELFGVVHPALQHALKKLLCAGARGAKDQAKDVQEAIDALKRWQEMQAEDAEAIRVGLVPAP